MKTIEMYLPKEFDFLDRIEMEGYIIINLNYKRAD